MTKVALFPHVREKKIKLSTNKLQRNRHASEQLKPIINSNVVTHAVSVLLATAGADASGERRAAEQKVNDAARREGDGWMPRSPRRPQVKAAEDKINDAAWR